MAESVSLEVQGRPEVTDVLPIALARELRGRRGLEGSPTTYGWSSTGTRKRQCHDFLVLYCEKTHGTKN